MVNGKFVISLDFELLWGVRDKQNILQRYGENIKGVHYVIPRMLTMFNEFGISATFSTVGFLFFETKEELLANVPKKLPNYINKIFSPYNGHFDLLNNRSLDQYHFASELINQVKQNSHHEIGSHTFSHYYCLEKGQTAEDFEADIIAAIKVAKSKGINITSLVFPRNQFNDDYLNVCQKLGIICYRGNEHSWLYEAKNGEQENKFRRAIRLMDAYINLSGNNCYDEKYLKSKFPIDMPASRFLRPFNKKLKMFDGLKLNRIKTGMTHAAKNDLVYHLWWHPHNFGINQNENFGFLKNILRHYSQLNKKFGFESITMSALANSIIGEG